VGTDPHRIVEQACALLNDPWAYRAMQVHESPFGDGHSAQRIANVLTCAHTTH
jgi:UDP-N-acetylglucosamine 2-epimerase